jgi:hypothetical protein
LFYLKKCYNLGKRYYLEEYFHLEKFSADEAEFSMTMAETSVQFSSTDFLLGFLTSNIWVIGYWQKLFSGTFKYFEVMEGNGAKLLFY